MRNYIVFVTVITDIIPTLILQEMKANRGINKISPVTPKITLSLRLFIRLHE